MTSQRQSTFAQPFSPQQQLQSTANLSSAARFAVLPTTSSSVPTGPSQVECDEFLVNAKKQLEIELARERSDTVVKLRKILQEGAKSHIEQKRKEAVNRLVGQTDTILQHAREDILTEVYSLFSASTTQHTTSIAPREHYNGKFRDVYKRIKVAEQENIKHRVQLGVQQVASHMMQEEAATKERRATEQVVERSLKTYNDTIATFAASSSSHNSIRTMNPSEYLQAQLATQRVLQEELNRLKATIGKGERST
eukprot:gene9456-6778_t